MHPVRLKSLLYVFKRACPIALIVSAIVMFLASAVSGSPSSDADQLKTVTVPQSAGSRLAVVYVIDESASMKWIFDDIKEILKQAITRSGEDDCISIVVFGDTVTTLGYYKSMDEPKKAKALKLIDSLCADSIYTNLEPAVNRGAEYLYDYFRGRAADRYVLVLLTDGKDHPPPGDAREHTLEQAITQHSSFIPGKQWTLQYIALKGELDPELMRLLGKYRGSFFDVEGISQSSRQTAGEVIDSIIKNPNEWEPFGAVVVDQVGEVKVRKSKGGAWQTLPKEGPVKIPSGNQVAVAAHSKAIVSFGPNGKVGLNENTEVGVRSLNRSFLKKSAVIELELMKGAIWNVVGAPPGNFLSYEIISPTVVTKVKGTILRVAIDGQTQEESVAVVKGAVEASPFKKEAKFETFELRTNMISLIPPLQKPSPPGPIPYETSLEWTAWEKALVKGVPLSDINFEPVLFTPLKESLAVGPIGPGKKLAERNPIKLSEKYYGGAAINVETKIDLPPGVEMNVRVNPVADDDLQRDVVVILKCPFFLKQKTSADYVGRIRFSCNDPMVRFTRDYVDLRVLNPRPAFTLFGWDCVPFIKYLIVGLACLGVVFIAALILAKRLRRRMHAVLSFLRGKMVKTKLVHLFRARPSGHLVSRDAMLNGGMKVFDLARISRDSHKIILGIGSDASNAIVLTDASVLPFHCSVWAGRRRNPTRVFVEPLADGHLAVNGEPVKDTRQLKDKDSIQIGECTFEFADIQFRHQVEVHMTDGTLHDGILEYWDLTHSLFYMTQTDQGQEQILSLRFLEVCYVHFYKDESERRVDILPQQFRELGEKQKKAVRLKLQNGETLEGFVHKKYHQKYEAGVFLMPLNGQTKIQYTYIPGTSIESLVFVDSA